MVKYYRFGYNPHDLDLEVKKTFKEYALCLCEFHDDTNPSMAFYYNTGDYFCYSCGARGSIADLQKHMGATINQSDVSGVLDAEDDDSYYSSAEDWKSLYRLTSSIKDEYVLNRGLTEEQIQLFGIRSNNDMVVFPFLEGLKIRWKNPKGNGRFMNFGKQPLTYGDTPTNKSEVFYVVESIWSYFHYNRYGYKCLSLLSSTNVYNFNNIAAANPNTKFIIAFDPDDSGFYNASKLMFLNRVYNNVYMFETFFDTDKEVDNERLFRISVDVRTKNTITNDPNFHFLNDKFGKDKFDFYSRLWVDFKYKQMKSRF